MRAVRERAEVEKMESCNTEIDNLTGSHWRQTCSGSDKVQRARQVMTTTDGVEVVALDPVVQY